MWYLVAGIAVVIGLVALDRLLCWMELRGWIYYRLTPRQRRSLGAAAFQVETLLQPEKKHVYELKQDAEIYRAEDEGAGAQPPDSRR